MTAERERGLPRCARNAPVRPLDRSCIYSDHGAFFDGDIHDAQSGMHKWAHRCLACRRSVRNVDWAQVLCLHLCTQPLHAHPVSSFFDKICGIQRNGRRYRGNLVPLLDPEIRDRRGRRRWQARVRPDRRASAVSCSLPVTPSAGAARWTRTSTGRRMSGHVSTFIVNGGTYDKIFWTEKLQRRDARACWTAIETPHPVNLSKTSPGSTKAKATAPNAPIRLRITSTISPCTWCVRSIKRDFDLFKYDFDNPGKQDAGG